MNSAAGHTNQVRVRAEAKLTKVEYPGNIAVNYNPILNAGGCSPVYQPIKYFDIIKYCTPPKPGNTMCNIRQ
uniref:Uncharacterized protein n=1 Tax=viral metagenome TaxID=1070528 RepID=A0A6C0CJ86_9ZZZZ